LFASARPPVARWDTALVPPGRRLRCGTPAGRRPPPPGPGCAPARRWWCRW